MKVSRDTKRDRRALALLGVVAILVMAYMYWPESDSTAVVAAGADSIPVAERRLSRMRQLAVAVPARQQALQEAAGELGKREKGLILADTANQAQARLLEILRRLARAQGVEIRGVELGQPKPFGDDYGEVAITVMLGARIEQIVNLLADLQSQPELIGTSDIQLTGASEKQKITSARMTISALVPRKLIPEKKGPFF